MIQEELSWLHSHAVGWLPLYSLRHALPFTFNSVDHSVHRGKEKNHEHRISIENYQYKSYLPWRKFVTKWHPSLLDVESKQIHSSIPKKQTSTIVLKTDDFEENNAENEMLLYPSKAKQDPTISGLQFSKSFHVQDWQQIWIMNRNITFAIKISFATLVVEPTSSSVRFVQFRDEWKCNNWP